jgi:hypothetical protein
MELYLKVDSVKLQKALETAAKDIIPELRIAMKSACRSVTSLARRDHKYTRKSGQLDRSIRYQVDQTGLYGEIFLDEGIAAYGKYQHDGTEPHQIRAKNKKALHFVKGGVPWFVPKKPYIQQGIKNPYWRKLQSEGMNVSFKGFVNHPGIKADKFLYRAFEKKTPEITKKLEEAVAVAFSKAGLT